MNLTSPVIFELLLALLARRSQILFRSAYLLYPKRTLVRTEKVVGLVVT